MWGKTPGVMMKNTCIICWPLFFAMVLAMQYLNITKQLGGPFYRGDETVIRKMVWEMSRGLVSPSAQPMRGTHQVMHGHGGGPPTVFSHDFTILSKVNLNFLGFLSL